MYELKRKVRFSQPSEESSAHNGYGGAPCVCGLGAFDEIEVAYGDEPQRGTGYLIDIKAIDRAVRSHAAPVIWCARRESPQPEPGEVLPRALRALQIELSGRVAAIKWHLTPYYAVEMRAGRPNAVIIRQKFDFAAAHRLHTPSLSEEENRRIFGKCNNPSGHGHNYQVEPAVEVELDASGRQPFALHNLEEVTTRVIVEPFDHKHLNVDTREFGPEGVNPTVENISRVFFDLLAPEVKKVCPVATLVAMTVWETDRTSCTFSPSR